LDKPSDATFDAAVGLFEANRLLRRELKFSSLPTYQLLCSVADATDSNADYGIGITAAHCHQIAWRYGQCVMDTLNQWLVVGVTPDGKVVTDQQHFRQNWPDIQQSLKVLPQIEYEKFLAAFEREAARAKTRLRQTLVAATTPPAAPPTGVKPVDDDENPAAETATKKEHSPWIDAPKMIELMRANAIRGKSDSTITRKKSEWKAEFQQGSNSQLFRFKLAHLRKLGITFPREWD
jgi:hypothetical protein